MGSMMIIVVFHIISSSREASLTQREHESKMVKMLFYPFPHHFIAFKNIQLINTVLSAWIL